MMVILGQWGRGGEGRRHDCGSGHEAGPGVLSNVLLLDLDADYITLLIL